MKQGSVKGIVFEPTYRFVIKDNRKGVYIKYVPQWAVEIEKSIQDKAGNRYYYDNVGKI